jgi:hypothetical protein
MSDLTDAIHRAVEAAYCEGVDTVKVEIVAIALAEKLEARLAELEAAETRNAASDVTMMRKHALRGEDL